MEKVNEHVLFKCRSCPEAPLLSKGCVLTEKGNVFFVYGCNNCGEQVNISLTDALTELYNGQMGTESKLVH